MNFSTPVDWPQSIESTSSLSNFRSSVSSAYSPQMTFEDSGDGCETTTNYVPKLTIIEQPQEKFRFRYKSEMMGTHGCILGRKSDRLLKTYPQVKLSNYVGENAVIRCSLVAFIGNKKEPVPHAHRLIVRVHDVDHEEPQELLVNEHCNFTAIFQGMGIVHTAKKYVLDELIKKKKRLLLDEIRGKRGNDTSLTFREEMQIKEEAQAESKMMNLNIVHLCFEALNKDSFGVLHPICDKVYSQPISNMKSAQTGELKICRIDKHVSSCLGGEEVFILVEKVGKKNIQIRFFEMDEEDNEIWEDFGKFTELDVHHQYAVVFKTPRYRDITIEHPVDVFLQLFRPSDKDTSEPIRFTYKPREIVGRKRLRSQVSYEAIPTAVVQGFTHQNDTAGFDMMGFNFNNNNMIENQSVHIERLQLSTTVASFTNIANSNFPAVVPNTPEGWANITIEDLIGENTENSFKSLNNCGIMDVFEGDLVVDCASKGSHGTVDNDLTTDCIISPPRKAVPENSSHIDLNNLDTDAVLLSDNLKYIKDNMKTSNKNLKSHLFSVNVIKQLCDQGMNTESLQRFLTRTTTDGNMTLHLVVTYCGCLLLKKILILMKKRKLLHYIDEENDHHQTPLHLAVLSKDQEKVKLLIQAGAEVEKKDLKGNTAYHLAVISQNQEKIVQNKNSHEYAVNYCLKELLIKKNFPKSKQQKIPQSLNITNEAGMTPLHLAVEGGDLWAAWALLQSKCNVNYFDEHGGCSALHMAIVKGNIPILKILLAQPSIDVEYCNRRGLNAVELASLIDDKVYEFLKERLNIKETTVKDGNLERKDDEHLSSDEDEIGQENQNSTPVISLDDSYIKKENENSGVDSLNFEAETDHDFVLEEQTLSFISKILDASGKWKTLASYLNFDFLVSVIEKQASPSRALLNYADVHGGVSVEKLKEILDLLQEKEAAAKIEKMICSQKLPTA